MAVFSFSIRSLSLYKAWRFTHPYSLRQFIEQVLRTQRTRGTHSNGFSSGIKLMSAVFARVGGRRRNVALLSRGNLLLSALASLRSLPTTRRSSIGVSDVPVVDVRDQEFCVVLSRPACPSERFVAITYCAVAV